MICIILLPCLIEQEKEFFDKTDFIVLLAGGDSEDRLKKSLEYYKKNVPLSKIIIYTGGDFTYLKTNPSNSRRAYFENNGIDNSNIIHFKNVNNTMEEIILIKEFMLKNNFKKVTIISDDYHAMRISFFANYVQQYKKYDLLLNIECSDYSQNQFFKNIAYKIFESIKLYYNLIKYTVFL